MTSLDLFKEGNFFRAKITRIEPSLHAAFVDYGAERHGFLPINQISGYDPKIHKVGAVILVSIDLVERGNKGAVMVAHGEIPNGVTVHKLYKSSSNKNLVFFYTLVICALGILVYVNT